MTLNNTALLIFANSAQAEGQRKSFKHASKLFNILNQDIEAKAKQTGLPYFIISESLQMGSSFGERITNAMQSIFNKGFSDVIVIGNDTPHLKVDHIKNALNKLQHRQLVIGPSNDGGFYLLGISKMLFNAKTFINLPWQTSTLNKTLIKKVLTHRESLTLLEPLTDIDSTSDLKIILNSYKSLIKALKLIILLILETYNQVLNRNLTNFNSYYYSFYFNKGSPVIV